MSFAFLRSRPSLPEHLADRLAGLDVPASVVELEGPEAWGLFLDDIERFSALGFGVVTQRRFLQEPHPELGGLTPLEVLEAGDGMEDVRTALTATLRRAFADPLPA